MSRAISITSAALFVVCSLIAVYALFRSRRSLQIWHRDPATVLGTMLSFHSGSKLSTACIEAFSATRKDKALWRKDKSSWTKSKFTPPVRVHGCVLLLFFYVSCLIVALLYLERRSRTNDGIVTVPADGPFAYLFLLWKSIPILAVLVVIIYASASNAAVRSLATFTHLSRRSSTPQELDVLLGMLGIRSLFYVLKFRSPSIVLTQLLTISCAFPVTLSSVLFTSQPAPELTDLGFPQMSWVGGGKG